MPCTVITGQYSIRCYIYCNYWLKAVTSLVLVQFTRNKIDVIIRVCKHRMPRFPRCITYRYTHALQTLHKYTWQIVSDCLYVYVPPRNDTENMRWITWNLSLPTLGGNHSRLPSMVSIHATKWFLCSCTWYWSQNYTEKSVPSWYKLADTRKLVMAIMQ